ncbi:ribosome recycling factor-domain-containing protein [Lipomyces japonicus]|uniref:ribosome recycling factor-domain-containing protein n=1 Tax=Lipomyces japonicus TaxID=56871 RepID=UPI0034CE28ED
MSFQGVIRANAVKLLRPSFGHLQLALTGYSVLSPRVRPIAFIAGVQAFRLFSSSSVFFKKAKKGKNNKEDQELDSEDKLIDIYDPSQYRRECEAVIKKLEEKVKELRMGKADTTLLNKVPVLFKGGEKYSLGDIAHVTTKGRQIVLSIYDPDHVKGIQHAIVNFDGSLNPTIDPKVDQTITIAIPPPSKEARDNTLKSIRAACDYSKSGRKNSVEYNREQALQKVKEMVDAAYPKDTTKKIKDQLEKIAKDFKAKIADINSKAADAVSRE